MAQTQFSVFFLLKKFLYQYHQLRKLNINISNRECSVYIVMMNSTSRDVFPPYNLTKYLNLYSEVYPRYIPRHSALKYVKGVILGSRND